MFKQLIYVLIKAIKTTQWVFFKIKIKAIGYRQIIKKKKGSKVTYSLTTNTSSPGKKNLKEIAPKNTLQIKLTK